MTFKFKYAILYVRCTTGGIMPDENNKGPENQKDVDFYKDGVVPANTEETRKKTADFLKAKRAEQKKPPQPKNNPGEEKPPEDKKNASPR